MPTQIHTALTAHSPHTSLLVLHGIWLPSSDDAQKGGMLIWAECANPSIQPDAGSGTRRTHPFAASSAEVARRVPLMSAIASERRLVLPQMASAPAASHALLREALGQTTTAQTFGFWRIKRNK